MYGYDQAMMGLGAPPQGWMAQLMRPTPTPGFPYKMKNPATGQVVYANAVGRDGLLRQGWTQSQWYTDPLVLGGAAVVVAILAFGMLK